MKYLIVLIALFIVGCSDSESHGSTEIKVGKTTKAEVFSEMENRISDYKIDSNGNTYVYISCDEEGCVYVPNYGNVRLMIFNNDNILVDVRDTARIK
jgi:hypothetical protein